MAATAVSEPPGADGVLARYRRIARRRSDRTHPHPALGGENDFLTVAARKITEVREKPRGSAFTVRAFAVFGRWTWHRLIVGALNGVSDQAADAGQLDGAEHQFTGPDMYA